MRDYTREINAESYNNLAEQLFRITGDVITLYGTINDSYLFYTDELKYKLGRVKLRKYFILYTKHKTCWTCSYHILLTDDDKKHDEFLQEWDKQQEELEA